MNSCRNVNFLSDLNGLVLNYYVWILGGAVLPYITRYKAYGCLPKLWRFRKIAGNFIEQIIKARAPQVPKKAKFKE